MSSAPIVKPGRKALSNYTGLGRSPVESHLRLAAVNPTAVARPPLGDFDNSNVFPWIANWLKTLGSERHAFEAYPEQGERGHYDLTGLLAGDGSIRIGIAGDWGTGRPPSGMALASDRWQASRQSARYMPSSKTLFTARMREPSS
ncbi:MAG: hypothetical protein KGN36_10005, partial [Acidobacteriota bacterium]|nr:hypothetical protein [Acidobacteriota bacterium]